LGRSSIAFGFRCKGKPLCFAIINDNDKTGSPFVTITNEKAVWFQKLFPVLIFCFYCCLFPKVHHFMFEIVETENNKKLFFTVFYTNDLKRGNKVKIRWCLVIKSEIKNENIYIFVKKQPLTIPNA